ncbi:1,2-phenylacetyl-CoA epoxidase subunit PaaD (plasmid) [Deinococcus radiomollis]|uniref:1,2-phenylacetyl-CoA epoxidase subunit PaaD n=1 Tax=Deinococcus radiomollis TaxID=468916 RepID=UPI0038915488
MAPQTETAVWNALTGVPDPEIPAVNIVEMGMVRGVSLDGDTVTVRFTPTFSGCPALQVIRDGIRDALSPLGFDSVEVETVISPPWSTDDITAPARTKLETYGVAPPSPAQEQTLFMALEPEAVRCPRCGSYDTRLTASFGSALCKRMHVCNACREPFEGMKSV